VKLEVGDTNWLQEAEKPSEKILKGIDAPQKSNHWQVGAQVLYSIRIEGRGDVLTRLVHLRLASLPLEGVKTVRINPTSPPADSKEVFVIHDPAEGKYDLAVGLDYKATMSFKVAGLQAGHRTPSSPLDRGVDGPMMTRNGSSTTALFPKRICGGSPIT
jgi:hypothetical protein